MLLAIETGYGACSVAMIDEGAVVATRHELIGRGHAERLVPLIGEVIEAAGCRPDAIVVDVGPGSFTGIRVGIAAARALGLVWQVPVHGFSAMTLMASTAFAGTGAGSVAVAMDAGRGEVFLQHFKRGLPAAGPLVAISPDAIAATEFESVIGTGAGALPTRLQTHVIADAPPDAADVRLLPAELRSLSLRPIYVRAPDAKLPPP